MKLLVSEVLYPEGHKYYNERLIKVLSTIGEILLLDDGAYYDQMNLPNNVIRERIVHKEPSVEKFYKLRKYLPFIKYEPLLLWSYIKYYRRISKIAKKNKIKNIILLTVQNNALSLSLQFFKGMNVYVFHHNDIDAINRRPIDTKLFKRSMNRVYHMVLAQFIKDGLVELTGVESDRVFVIHEPSSIGNSVENISFIERERIFVGLGDTCEETIINDFQKIDKEISTQLPYKIILRNKIIEYNGNNLKIIKGYLTREEFDYYLTKAICCLVFYPDSFKMRYSGIIDDALNNGMRVYGTDIPVMHYFAKEYPESCHILKNIKDCFTTLQDNPRTANPNEVRRFIESHSFEYVKNQLVKALSH